MSYSINSPCWQCTKQDTCMDGTILTSAVSIIHNLGPAKGHLGGGSITHKCTYGFENRDQVSAAPEE